MRTIEVNDCLRCPFVDLGVPNAGFTRIDCNLMKLDDPRDHSCVPERKLGVASGFVPENVPPPERCPLPVRVVEIDKPVDFEDLVEESTTIDLCGEPLRPEDLERVKAASRRPR